MKYRGLLISLAGLPLLSGSIFGADATQHGGGKPNGGEPKGRAAAAQDAIKSFKLDPEIKASLVAAEPLLANPVAFSQDAQGRWYIAETYRQEKGVEDNRGHGNWLDADLAARTTEDRLAMMHKFYPDEKRFAERFTKGEERIVRLEDSDGDGVFDKQSIYADGFRDPLDGTGAGILVRGNDVWWTCIPHLWRFQDADGDGKAEVREKLLSGFGVKFAFRGHDMHGLRFGPDGRLYFSIGDRGLNVRSKEGQQLEETDGGAILRCRPDGSEFEIFATGVRNPQELAFDEYGNLFTGDNNSDSADKARFVYLVEGGDSGWRMAYQYLNDRGPWNREALWDEKEAPKAKYIIPPIANIGNGPSGLTYNPGTALGTKYQRQFFLSDFRGGAGASVIHQIALEPAGAGFKLKERRDFLKGLLTTDCEFGNDGALYGLDWVEGWNGPGKGRIYKFSDSSANTELQAQTAKLIAEGMSQRAEPELIGLLAHPDQRVRQAAQFALAEKAAPAALAKLAGDAKANQLARLHAIWALGQIGEKDAKALAGVPALLADGDAEVRAQSAKVLGECKQAAAGDQLMALLKDPAPRVRYFAALSLGKLAHKAAVQPLLAMLAENNDQDPILRHGGVMGLARCASAEQLSAKAGDGSVAVRIGAVLALRRQGSPAIAAFLKDADEGVVLEAARAIHDVPISAALPALAELSVNPALKSPRIFERVINAHYRLGKAENAKGLVALAVSGTTAEVVRKDALDALTNWAAPKGQDRVLNIWRPIANRPADDAVAAVSAAVPTLLKDGRAGIQEMAAKMAAKLAIGSAGEVLGVLVANDKAESNVRIAALEALVSLKDKNQAQSARVAFQSSDSKLRSVGLQVLTKVDPAAAVAGIGERIASAPPSEKQAAVAALGQIRRPEAAALLLKLMDELIANKVAPEIALDVFDAATKANSPELKAKLAEYSAALAATDPLAPYMVALMGGDAERGKKIFQQKAEVQCLRCHKCEVGDSLVGPELTHIAAKRDRRYLLESIVFPNKTVADGFGIVSVTLKAGGNVAGRLVSEDARELKVETTDDKGKPMVATVLVADIKERTNAPSPMPENTRDNLTRAELRDVVEYLANLK